MNGTFDFLFIYSKKNFKRANVDKIFSSFFIDKDMSKDFFLTFFDTNEEYLVSKQVSFCRFLNDKKTEIYYTLSGTFEKEVNYNFVVYEIGVETLDLTETQIKALSFFFIEQLYDTGIVFISSGALLGDVLNPIPFDYVELYNVIRQKKDVMIVANGKHCEDIFYRGKNIFIK